MEAEILQELKEELQNEADFNEIMLKNRIKNAIREVKAIRRYPKAYTENQINDDMNNFYSVVRAVALYDYNLVGAEGEQGHTENGISRNYVKRESLFGDVLPLARL